MKRTFSFLIMMICVAALSIGYFLEYVQHLVPCLLCVAQRGVLAIIAGIAGLLWIYPFQKKTYWAGNILILLSTVIGVYFAGKQLYLESLPVELRPACTIPFETLIASHEWSQAFMQLLQGTSDCGARQWALLGLSLPFWSGLIFVVIAITVVINLRTK